MEKKIIIYFTVGILLLMLIGEFAIGSVNEVVINKEAEDMSDRNSGNKQLISYEGEDLTKYRSTDIPSNCRLPEYDENVDKWVEHLGHHQETQECLKYYN